MRGVYKGGLIVLIAGLLLILPFLTCQKKVEEGKTVIRYCQWSGVKFQPVVHRIIEEFEKAHPDIKVEAEFYPRFYWTKLFTMAAGRVAPDVWFVSPPYVPDYARNRLLLDLTPYVEREEKAGNLNMDDYYKVIVDSFRVKGRLYGLPMQFGAVALYYNKDLFLQAGLPYPDDTWDWYDLVRAAKKLTKDIDGDGIVDQWGFHITTNLETYIANFIWQNGGSIVNEQKTRALIDQPEAVEAVQFLVDLRKKYKVIPSVGFTDEVGMDTAQLFQTGKVAMSYQGSWYMTRYADSKTLNFDVAPLPKGKRRMVTVNGLANGINIRTKHPEAAWKFVRFYASEPAQRLLGEMKRGIPAMKRVANSPAFLNPNLPPDNEKVFLIEAAEYAHDLFPTYGRNEWGNLLVEKLDKILRGDKKDVQKGLKEAAEVINEILEKYNREAEEET